jgi:hypothetical protein
MLDKDPNSLQKNISLDEYAVGRFTEDIGETSLERVTSAVQSALGYSYSYLAIGDNDRFAAYQLLAQKVYDHYQNKMGNDQKRVSLPPMKDLKRDVLNEMLDVKEGLPFAARAVIRTQLGMPLETASTNSVATPAIPDITTNAPAATNSVGK